MSHIRSTVAIVLASIVLIASMSVTVNLHLCAGQVQSIAFFGRAKPCKDVKKPCHGMVHHSKKNGCCEEQSIVLKGKETIAEVKSATQINPSFNLVAVILPTLCLIIEVDSSVTAPDYAHYKPPQIERDITLFVLSFLI